MLVMTVVVVLVAVISTDVVGSAWAHCDTMAGADG